MDPLRFGEHLSLCVRSNDPEIVQALRTQQRDDATPWNDAMVIQGYFARHGAPHLVDPRLRLGLLCGQTAVDLALVRDGHIAQPQEFIEQLQALARKVDLLLVKPHPYEPDLGQLAQVVRAIPNAVWTGQNIYALLCAENLEFVCAISSGALREASYFLKPSIALTEPDRNRAELLPPNCSPWMAVGADILSAEFFARCCCARPVSSAGTRRVRLAPDALDRIFGVRWGLDDKDAGLPAFPPITPGRRYPMRAGHAQSAWLHFGWQAPGADGTYSRGLHAAVVMPVGRDALPAHAGAVVLRVKARLAAGGSLDARIVGPFGGQRSFEAKSMSALLHFDLPVHVHACGDAGVVAAHFELQGAGALLCIEELSLLPAGAAPPRTPLRGLYLLRRTLRAVKRRVLGISML